jgi:hypothetical protein
VLLALVPRADIYRLTLTNARQSTIMNDSGSGAC